MIYAALMACAGFMHTVLRIYVGSNHRLVSNKHSTENIKRGILLSLTTPVWFTVSIGIAYFSSVAAQISWILVFIIYAILVNRLRDKVLL
jgi:uncharacterized membrane protein